MARGKVPESKLTCVPLDIGCAKSVRQFASTIRCVSRLSLRTRTRNSHVQLPRPEPERPVAFPPCAGEDTAEKWRCWCTTRA